MKAAVYYGPGDVRIEDVREPGPPGPGPGAPGSRPHPRPSPTTAGPTRSTRPAIEVVISSSTAIRFRSNSTH